MDSQKLPEATLRLIDRSIHGSPIARADTVEVVVDGEAVATLPVLSAGAEWPSGDAARMTVTTYRFDHERCS